MTIKESYALQKIELNRAISIVEKPKYNVTIGVIDTGLNKLTKDGYNFITDSAQPISDTSGHGSMVASVMYSMKIHSVFDKLAIIPLKVDINNNFSEKASIEAIKYATVNKIDIINYSNSTGIIYNQTFFNTLSEYNGLFICSAGNNGYNLDIINTYPSCYMLTNSIVVTAIDKNDKLAYFSNYSKNYVHIAAPGVNIIVNTNKNRVKIVNGTSLSTPYVSMVAALIKSMYGESYKGFIKKCILNSVDTSKYLHNKVSSGGRLNAYRALIYAKNNL